MGARPHDRSAPESQVMDVYNAFSALTSPDVPAFLMSTVNEADAKAAYAAFLKFKDVVKANPITPAAVSTPAALNGKLGAIDAAAGKLSSAAYPFMKDVDWTSDLSLKPLPGVSLKDMLKAIGSIDAKGLTTEADFAAINAGLGKAVASVPASKVMDVYNAFAKVVPGTVPNYLYSTVNPNDAQAAYRGFLEFKDVVKAAR